MIEAMTTIALRGLPSPDALKALLVARGPQIATWVLGIVLGVQAAVMLTGHFGSGQDSPGTAPTVPLPSAQRLDVAALVNAHLFGEAKVTSGGDPNAAPETSLALVLAGIIANSDPQKGIAIIGESAANAKVVTVGNPVPGGAKLHAVYGDRVVLERNGALESLMLPRQAALAATRGPAPARLSAPPAAGDIQILDRMRQMVANDPGIIGDVMRPQPVFAEGKQRGYRVYPGRNRAAFARLGLRPGDLVTAINGTPLDDPSRGNQIFNTLASASEAHLTVMRSGRQQDIALNLAQLATEAEQLAAPPAQPDPAAAAVDPGDTQSVDEPPPPPPSDERGD